MKKISDKATRRIEVIGFIAVTLILLMIAMSGCVNAKKATRFMRENPQVAAEFCADEFPVKTVTDSAGYKQSLAVIDSLISAQDSERLITQAERDQMIEDIERLKATAEPDCDSLTEAVYRYAAKEKARADKLDRSNNALIKAAKNVKPIRDTVENTARVKALQMENESLTREINLKADQLAVLKDRVKGKVLIPWWILVIAGLSLAGWSYWRIKAGALRKLINKFKP